jgi:hypothetical protein
MLLQAVVPVTTVSAANVSITAALPSFTGAHGLLSMGGAAQIDGSGSLVLTENLAAQHGYAWLKEPLVLRDSHSFSAHFSFTLPGGAICPGEGLAFVLQSASNTAGSAGRLGYTGIAPSFALEFDTLANEGDTATDAHVGLNINGSLVSNHTVDLVDLVALDDQDWFIWVDYDGVNRKIDVRTNLANDLAGSFYLVEDLVLDLDSTLGSMVYAGFTASTGECDSSHVVKSFYFNNTYLASGIDSLSDTYEMAPAARLAMDASALTTVGQSTQISVTAYDRNDVPQPNQEISFSAPGATLSDTTATTDALGQAYVTLTAPTTPGDLTITAMVTTGAAVVNTVTVGNAVPVIDGANPIQRNFTQDGAQAGFEVPLTATDIGDTSGLTWSIVAQPANSGVLSLPEPPTGASVTATYTPEDGNFVGTDTFNVTVTDAEGDTDTKILSINILAQNALTAFTSSAPDLTIKVGQDVTHTFTTDGLPMGKVEVTSGALPDGLSLTADGQLVGKAETTAGSPYTVMFTAIQGLANAIQPASIIVEKGDASVSFSSEPVEATRRHQNYEYSVAVQGGGTTPSGQVIIADGAITDGVVEDGAASCDAWLTNGEGTCSLASTTAGMKTITAYFVGDANYHPASAVTTHEVSDAKEAPILTIDSDLSTPTAIGDAYEVAITLSGSGLPAPSGDVTISDGADSCAISPTGGAGSCMLRSTTGGNKTVTATYPGDDFYTAASASKAHEVTRAETITAVTADLPDPSTWGDSVTFDVEVTSSYTELPLTGAVEVQLDKEILCSVETLTDGLGSCSTSGLPVGSLTGLIARYDGDANFAGSVSEPFSHQVNQAESQVVIVSDLSTATLPDESYMVRVRVTGVQGEPSGTVDISDDQGASCTTAELEDGIAECVLASTVPGMRQVTAAYAGDATFKAASDTVDHPVSRFTPVVEMDQSSASAVYGQPATISVTVSGPVGSPVSTGTVQMHLNGSPSGDPLALVDGEVSVSVQAWEAGAYEVSFTYPGDAVFDTAASTDATQTITPAASEVTITPSSSTPDFGQDLTLTVDVRTEDLSTATPAGAVQIQLDSSPMQGTHPLTDGQVVITIPTAELQPASTYTFLAKFVSDSASIASADSEWLTVTVGKAQPNITISRDVENPVGSQPVTFTATVAACDHCQAAPTGSVAFQVDGVDASLTMLLVDGQASGEIPLAAGTFAVTVAYNGDVNYAETTSAAFTHVVAKSDPILTLEPGAPTTAVFGQELTFTISTEANPPATAAPEGGFTIGLNGTDYCTYQTYLGETGCSFTVTRFPSAGDRLSMSYSGDTNYNMANFDWPAPVVERADAEVSFVAISAPNPVAGQTVTVKARVSAVGDGFATPTGNVLVTDENTGKTCTAAFTAGEYACDLPLPQAGSLSLRLDFQGDENMKPATAENIDAGTVAPTPTLLSVQPNLSSMYGQPVTFTAIVSPVLIYETNLTGTVTFFDGLTQIGAPVAVDPATRHADSAPFAFDGVGARTITAQYSGDANYQQAGGFSITHEVYPAVSALSITASANPTIYGLPVTVTAQVSAMGPSPVQPADGAVQFVLDGADYGEPVNLSGTGEASILLPYSVLPVGTHLISARYEGSVYFTSASSPAADVSLVVDKGDLGVETVFQPTSPVYGEAVTLTLNLTSPSGEIPTGTVSFSLNGTVMDAGVPLVNGSAVSTEWIGLPPGSHDIELVYSGDTNFNGETVTLPNGLTIAKGQAVPAISGSLQDEVLVGEPFEVAVDVLPSFVGAEAPTGQVTVRGGDDVCMIDITAGDTFCTLVALEAGTLSLTLEYSGDDTFEPVTVRDISGPQVLPAATVVQITGFSPESPVVGQEVTVNFSVLAVDPSTRIPTGAVRVEYGDAWCEGEVQSDGTGSCALTAFQANRSLLFAWFTGSNNYNASPEVNDSRLTVQPAETSTTVKSNQPNPVLTGDPMFATARVTVESPGAGMPTGMIQFQIDGENIGAPVRLENGEAQSAPILGLKPGTHALTAVYQPAEVRFAKISVSTTSYRTSTSLPVSIIVVEGDIKAGVDGVRGGSLNFTAQTDGGPAKISMTIPAGAVDQDTILVVTVSQNPGGSLPAGKKGFGFFTLRAYVGGELQKDFTFTKDITMTVSYDESGMAEKSLKVMAWNGKVWTMDGIELVEHDQAANRLTVKARALQPFGLVADAQIFYMLPMIINN